MARRRRIPGVASDAGGERHYRSTPTTSGKPPPGIRGPVRPRRTPQQKAAEDVGRAVTKGAHAVNRGAQSGPIQHVLREAERERKVRERKEGRHTILGINVKEHVPSYLRHPLRLPARGARGIDTGSLTGLARRGAKIDTTLLRMLPGGQEAARHVPRQIKPYTDEEVVDIAVGKAASNLLFHGERSHPVAAGLEIGSLLPIFRGPKFLYEAARGARAVQETETATSVARQFIHLQRKTTQAERRVEREHGPIPPELQKEFEKGDARDWKAWSRARGYTETEIADHQRWLDLHKKYPGLTPDMRVGEHAYVSHENIRAHVGNFFRSQVGAPLGRKAATVGRAVAPARTPPSVGAMERRLKALDKLHRKQLKAVIAQHAEIDPKMKQLVTAQRNMRRGKRKGIGLKTVNQEIRDKAEGLMESAALKFPESEPGKLWHERQAIRDSLNARAEQAFGPEVPEQGVMPFEQGKPVVRETNAGAATPPGEPPKPPTGFMDVPVGPWRDPEQAIPAGLRSAKGQARKRAAEISAGRKERLQASELAGKGLAGEERLIAELGAHKGEFATDLNPFEHFREGVLPEETYNDMLEQVNSSHALTQYQRLSARNALRGAYREGRLLRKAEVRDLMLVFGPDVQALSSRTGWDVATDILGIPRSLQASTDISFPMRQGLVLGMRHPVSSAKAVPQGVKALGSEGHYEAKLAEMHSDPEFEQAVEDGLSITELSPQEQLHEGLREEQFPSALVERPVTVGGANVNLPGRVVRASGRAFTLNADLARFGAYKRQMELALKRGDDWANDDHLRQSMAKFINTASGRGDLGKLQPYGPAANALFFSPRLFKSRVDLLNPFWYASLHPRARLEAARAMGTLGIAAAGVIGAAIELGAPQRLDPRSSDFGKLKIGDTRFDTVGGLAQYLTFASRMAPNAIGGGGTVNAHGRFIPFGPNPGQQDRWETLLRFARSKASPPVGLAADILSGKTFVGDPLTLKGELYKNTVPLVIQDTLDLSHGDPRNVPLALLGYGISTTGISMNTYGDRPSKYGVKLLDALKKAGIAKPGETKLRGPAQKAVDLRAERNEYRLRGSTPQKRYALDADFLYRHKLWSKAQRDAAEEWSKHASELEAEQASRDYVTPSLDQLYGNTLSDLRAMLKARGVKGP